MGSSVGINFYTTWFYRMRLKLTSEQAVVVLGRAIDAVGSLVFLKMLSTLTTKSNVGVYLLASSYLALALTISFSAFDQGFLRNITEYRKQSVLAARYSAMLVSYFSMACMFSVFCVMVMSTFDIGTALHAVMAPLSLWLIFEAIKNLNTTMASGLRSRTVIASASAIDYGCRIGLLWAIYFWGTVSPGVLLYVLAAAGVAVSMMILSAQRSLLTGFSWSDVRDTLLDSIKFSWPMIFWGMFGWLQNMSNRWLLSNFSDLSAVAEYGVLVAISTFPVTALLGLVGTYIQPIIYEHESSNAGSSRLIVRKAALGLVPVCGVPVLIAAIWHREIMVLLAGANYIEHSYFLPFIMFAVCTSAICSVLTYSIFAQRRVASLLLANTLPGAFSLAVGYFAVKSYQFEGAVLALVLSHVLAGFLSVLTFLRTKLTTSVIRVPQNQ